MSECTKCDMGSVSNEERSECGMLICINSFKFICVLGTIYRLIISFKNLVSESNQGNIYAPEEKMEYLNLTTHMQMIHVDIK